MKRNFEKKLLDWKNSGMKKPLMVIGARQIGKTYLINEFIRENFEDYLYFNLEKEVNIRNIFDRTINDEEIISYIELYLERKIDIDRTVFFFDEVQVSENFIVSLKYFNESDRPYKIICAGSLLGVKLNRFSSSFPVGKVRMEYMSQLNFEEFLLATGNEMLRNTILEHYLTMKPMPDFAHNKALGLYKAYLCVGGMPESVNNYIENNQDILEYDSHILMDIKEMYIADMKKYVNNSLETVKIEKVYKSIPSQLVKKNKAFKYNYIDEMGRKRKYESSIDWLVASKMILINHNVKRIEIPLKVYNDENIFKLYLSDVGLLTTISEVKYSDIMLDNLFMYKGVLAENYVAQELNSVSNSLYYWTSKRDAEIDFLLYTDNDGIIPIEVKARNNVKSASLNVYMSEYKPKYAIRFSIKNFGFENNIKSIPLYAVFCVK